MKQENKLCRKCGAKLEVRQTKRTPGQLKKPYYYTAYYFCPQCHKLYHSDEFKMVNPQTSPLQFDSQPQEKIPVKEAINIWTDGACVANGTPQARAAWAFVSGKTEKAGLVEGKQTNNVAEGLAIYHALKWAAATGAKNIRLHTDSQISLFNLQKPPEKVKMNAEIFYNIAKIVQNNKLNVTYVKVLGHSGDEQNERVDRLANGLATMGK